MKTISTFRTMFLGAVCAVALTLGTAATSRAQDAPFFAGATVVGTDANGFTVQSLPFFQQFTLDLFPYVYKYNFGYLYYLSTDSTGQSAAYFYDFTSQDIVYTTPTLYPYFYDFSKSTFLYYFEGSSPRTFYNFATSSYLQQ